MFVVNLAMKTSRLRCKRNIAVLVLLVMILVAIPGRYSINFSFEGCSTQNVEVIALFAPSFRSLSIFGERFIKKNSPGSSDKNKSTQRVKYAAIFLNDSETISKDSFSSWHFKLYSGETFSRQNYVYNMKLKHTSWQEIVGNTIDLVQELSFHMAEDRHNTIRVGVVFLDNADGSIDLLSLYELIIGLHNVDREGIAVKILVVVTDYHRNTYIISVGDTIITNPSFLNFDDMTLAICKQCKRDWVLFEHTDGSLSCYNVYDASGKYIAGYAERFCGLNGGSVVTVETQDELNYLKAMLRSNVIGLQYLDIQSSDIYISLHRDSKSSANIFYWTTINNEHHPLVVNNWLPGTPSCESRRRCVVWRVASELYSVASPNIGRSSMERRVVNEGWADIECGDEASKYILCEMVLSRKVADTNVLIIKPASNESFSQALAKGNFVKVEDTMVSVSKRMANSDLWKQSKETGRKLVPLFDCGEDIGHPRYISFLFVCDGTDQCLSKRDETWCKIQDVPTADKAIQDGVCSCPIKYYSKGFRAGYVFYNNAKADCTVCVKAADNNYIDGSDVSNGYSQQHTSCEVICHYNHCLLFSHLSYVNIDCIGPTGPLDKILDKLATLNTCTNTEGHSIWVPTCVYVRDVNGAVLGCTDMSHLNNCKDFVCPEGYVKCPNIYCIPQHYVLDGQADCPTGEDEVAIYGDNTGPCTGNFACWGSKVCLHPDLVCDGHSDCPHQDDEIDCKVSCAEGLLCVSGTVTVSPRNRSAPLNNVDFVDPGTRYIDLSGLDLSAVENVNAHLFHTKIMILSKCNISELKFACNRMLGGLVELDLSFNLLRKYDCSYLRNIRYLNLSYTKDLIETIFQQNTFLEVLDLSHTGLLNLSASFALDLPNLKHLNLSFSRISSFRLNTFPSSFILHTLDIRGLPVDVYSEEFFNGLTISKHQYHLYTDRFEMCCPQIRGPNIPAHTCHAPDDAISTCLDLVGVNVQRVLLWVVAVLAVLGNMTVIIYRVIWDRAILRTGYGLFVTNLGISDFIMGVYLFIIAGADYYYRGIYVLHDKTWREGIVCRIAGFLATLSSETSTCFVFLITLDRFLVMKFPFGQVKFSNLAKYITILLSWVVGFLLALTPVVFRFEIYSSNAMCLGLPLTNTRLHGWGFSFGVFIVLNFLMFLVIAGGQIAIFRAMSENRITGAGPGPSPRRAADVIVAKQLSLVAMSNFLCWFPVGCMGLLSLGGHEVSNDVYAWTTVIVLPINSAANPLLYTIPVLMDKWDKFKHNAMRA